MPANPKKTVEQYLKTQLSVQDDEIIREIYQEFLQTAAETADRLFRPMLKTGSKRNIR